jgi:para-nitrobenzyl esterase
MYLFAWRSPLREGAYGSCHALDLPFSFGNLDLPGIAEFAGSGPGVERLARNWMDAWAAFARSGDPSHPGIGSWPHYTAETRDTMVFGEKSGATRAPCEAERAACDALEGGAALRRFRAAARRAWRRCSIAGSRRSPVARPSWAVADA